MGICVLFSYFDTSIGPVTFMAKPSIEEVMQKRINSLMDIDIENSVFEHSFQELITFNYMFSLESPKSRGGSILCMLTVCLEEHPKEYQQIYEILEKYVKIFKKIPDLDLLLAKDDLERKELEEIELEFNTEFNRFFNEIKLLPEIYTYLLPEFIPGFFKYLKDESNDSILNWVSLNDEFALFIDILTEIVKLRFNLAYKLWKKIDDTLIHDEEIKIKYLLMGAFVSLKLKKYDAAYHLAESALKLAETSSFIALFIDAIIMLIECGSHIGMIMIFETALADFDASCGLSNYILEHYDRFYTLLEKGLALTKKGNDSIPEMRIRQSIILMLIGQFKMLKYKQKNQRSILEESINYLNDSYEILKSYSFITIFIKNRVVLSLIYEILKDFEKTLMFLEDAYDLTSKISGNIKYYYTAWIFQRQGWNYLHNGYIKETLDKFQHSLFEIKKINPIKNREILLAITQIRICYILSFEKGDIKKILNYFESSREILEKYNKVIELTRLYYVMGDIFKGEGKLSEALKYYEECEQLARKINDEESIGISLTRKAKIAAETLNLDQALNYYQDALSYFEKINHPQFLGITQGEIGAVYQALDNKENAIKYYKLGLKSFKKEGNELESYWILYKLVSLILDTDYTLAEGYANKLIALRKRTNSDIIKQASRLVEALIFSNKENSRERMKSIFLLEQIAEERIIQHHLSHAALIHLCDLLLKDLLITFDNHNIIGLEKCLENLSSISQEFHFSHELIEIDVLRSKIALIQNNIKQAENIINKAKELCIRLKISEMNIKVEKQITLIKKYQNEIASANLKKLDLKHRLDMVNFIEEMKNFIRIFNL